MELKGKVCIITGGTSGIGLCIVRELLRNEVKHIALFELDNRETRRVFHDLKNSASDKIGFYSTDVANIDLLRENFDQIIKKYETVDILINNAGIISENIPDRMIDINYKAAVMGTLLMIDRVGKHKGGKGGIVVNIASIAGLINILLPIYCSTKHAIVSFTRTMEEHFEATGVRVIAICPGHTDTQLLTDITKGLDFIDYSGISILEYLEKQSPENVALAVCQIINNGKNETVWVVEDNLPPYPVKDIDHYSVLRIE